MPSNRKFYRREYKVVLLSEEPIGDLCIEGVAYAMTHGGMSGSFETLSHQEVSGPAMARMLEYQGSEPQYFQLDSEGNDDDG